MLIVFFYFFVDVFLLDSRFSEKLLVLRTLQRPFALGIEQFV